MRRPQEARQHPHLALAEELALRAACGPVVVVVALLRWSLTDVRHDDAPARQLLVVFRGHVLDGKRSAHRLLPLLRDSVVFVERCAEHRAGTIVKREDAKHILERDAVAGSHGLQALPGDPGHVMLGDLRLFLLDLRHVLDHDHQMGAEVREDLHRRTDREVGANLHEFPLELPREGSHGHGVFLVDDGEIPGEQQALDVSLSVEHGHAGEAPLVDLGLLLEVEHAVCVQHVGILKRGHQVLDWGLPHAEGSVYNACCACLQDASLLLHADELGELCPGVDRAELLAKSQIQDQRDREGQREEQQDQDGHDRHGESADL
mmetsp:Transcript_87173/g.226417  ORF Transcript_87173/g.226417 Transcript_87173/m.226417 type:complete len:319 (-) Transcript_87173:396-1352(-)